MGGIARQGAIPGKPRAMGIAIPYRAIGGGGGYSASATKMVLIMPENSCFCLA